MLKFLVFADFHYKKGMYASTLTHLEAILKRAHDEGAEFIIHLGDFCNDYAGSPEAVNAYLHNGCSLPVFGVYGNHELETRGNTMENVTPLLCSGKVTFGKDGAGYWHHDIGCCRLIGLDTNYSFNPETAQWQHNLPASWGAPEGNLYANSLGPEQLEWLEKTVAEAHGKGQKALIFSHAGLSGEWESSPDAEKVREIFGRYKRTVLMCLNGHLHTNHFCEKDGVAYFDVNTVLNGCWKVCTTHHYAEEHTFIRETFDADGNINGTEEARLDTLTQGINTWFFEDPLSAIVEITDGGIKITGSRTEWKHGIAPFDPEDGIKPEITDR